MPEWLGYAIAWGLFVTVCLAVIWNESTEVLRRMRDDDAQARSAKARARRRADR